MRILYSLFHRIDYIPYLFTIQETERGVPYSLFYKITVTIGVSGRFAEC